MLARYVAEMGGREEIEIIPSPALPGSGSMGLSRSNAKLSAFSAGSRQMDGSPQIETKDAPLFIGCQGVQMPNQQFSFWQAVVRFGVTAALRPKMRIAGV